MSTGRLRVIFAGGGTGGHVYPAIAMMQALEQTVGVDSIFVGVRGGMEERILAGRAERLELLSGRGLRGASLATRLMAPARLVSAVVAGLRLLREFRPDVVVGTGGYASAAMVIAAVIARVPRILQEQNSVPGLVNRRLAPFAQRVLASFESSKPYLRAAREVLVTGNPLRALPEVSRADAAARLGILPDRPTVLVIGGSRGAHSLNLAGADAAAEMVPAREIQFLMLTGSGDADTIGSRFETLPGVRVLPYLEEVELAYAVSDIAVARSGASSVFELAAAGVPTEFVPYPWAADDHQRLNAAELVALDACIVIDDAGFDGRRLADALGMLLDNPARRTAMSEAMRKWAPQDAAGCAAAAIVESVKKKHEIARGAGSILGGGLIGLSR